ncbi:XRE family transcriptional regulator [Leptolyngbya boryana NIES-2135]|jgi:transcriptional regulator with XRE-family HTH domain|uniref:XRE family transcriptional regulator n=1 Tax=Leptolyngbya boryana NIES-2135 TaxID=1973484 RepID=A0A1Z4JPB7_LEPBY|nr:MULTISPECIES: helix-turn-helix transcriptional regulator [Leptolyngbya]BAY58550.1 XRE family transcriptional regulator [Leptolyngbya boryana NIES-2135]MBD2370773.1 helix-turn-helix transcriptional regulator [Leptolyngbya sp. FACHB-161]MBD2377074.1 helix-turn-helix transcriptional regulator [Leptolyngbya sp. FACHB-238]MBD2401517.1 helix-turn-helix transcriptional regulator [Leptolyngbya sp. FACHB-239]MBD2408069.1 helix-turn-helix transcriptional regulator [Leptolyngbya sp. FACHB-402]
MKNNEEITPAGLRTRAGLTQRQVAERLNKRVQTISDWERGTRRPQLTFSETILLMKLYQCSLEDLSIAFDRINPDEIN